MSSFRVRRWVGRVGFTSFLAIPLAAGVHPAAAADPTLAAVVEAAERVGVDPVLLVAIAYEESALHPYALNVEGQPRFPASIAEASDLLHHHEASRSIDIGALQVNRRWVERLNDRGPIRMDAADLLDPDVGATLGAAVLKAELDATHGDVWRAVARYHTGPERPDNRARGQRYAAAVRRTYERLSSATRVANPDPVGGSE